MEHLLAEMLTLHKSGLESRLPVVIHYLTLHDP